jgi:hypothetical protein
VLIGVFFVDDPLLRLLWMIRVILITFYAISVMTDSVGLVMGYLIVIVETWKSASSCNFRAKYSSSYSIRSVFSAK